MLGAVRESADLYLKFRQPDWYLSCTEASWPPSSALRPTSTLLSRALRKILTWITP